MRLLFTAYPLLGHVNPMLPLVHAARRAGHDARFATGADLAAPFARQGVEHWPVGPTHAEVAATTPPSARWFAVSADARAKDLMSRARVWRPDAVIADEFDLAGPVIARCLDIPLVVHGLGVMLPMPIWTELAPAVDALHAARGLSAGAEWVRSARYLETMPAALRPDSERVWSRASPLRPVSGLPAPGERLPAAIDALPHEESVHLTLGTLFHTRARHVLEVALRGLRALPVNLIVTCGPGVDSASFGAQPGNVFIAPYLPHALLLPRCRLVVSQGGAGIMLGALAHGIPQLMLPIGADQFINATLGVRAGVALALQPDAISAEAVEAAARRLRAETGFSVAAALASEQIRSMPSAEAVIDDVVREIRAQQAVFPSM